MRLLVLVAAILLAGCPDRPISGSIPVQGAVAVVLTTAVVAVVSLGLLAFTAHRAAHDTVDRADAPVPR